VLRGVTDHRKQQQGARRRREEEEQDGWCASLVVVELSVTTPRPVAAAPWVLQSLIREVRLRLLRRKRRRHFFCLTTDVAQACIGTALGFGVAMVWYYTVTKPTAERMVAYYKEHDK